MPIRKCLVSNVVSRSEENPVKFTKFLLNKKENKMFPLCPNAIQTLIHFNNKRVGYALEVKMGLTL